ncbi:hypothetical protein [Tepidibacillus marianensis]
MTKTGQVVFDLPKDMDLKTLKLQVQTGIMGTEKDVILLQK